MEKGDVARMSRFAYPTNSALGEGGRKQRRGISISCMLVRLDHHNQAAEWVRQCEDHRKKATHHRPGFDIGNGYQESNNDSNNREYHGEIRNGGCRKRIICLKGKAGRGLFN